MTHLEKTKAVMLVLLDMFKEASEDLPSSSVDGVPWGERRQLLDEGVSLLEAALSEPGE